MAPSISTDAEYTALVNVLERLVLMALAESSAGGGEDETKASDRVPSETSTTSGGLLGYMSNVLSHNELEPAEMSEETKVSISRCIDSVTASSASILTLASQAKHSILERVRDTVNLLLLSWDVTSGLERSVNSDQESSQGHYAARAKLRARRALERIYKATTSDTLEGVVKYWRLAPGQEVRAAQTHGHAGSVS